MRDVTELTPDHLRGMPLPEPEGGSKEGRGRVLVVGGSPELPGAVLLAGTSVLRAGAGKLQVATCRSVAPHVATALPEARVVALDETEAGGIAPDAAGALAERAGACAGLLIGPGLMDTDATAALTGGILTALDGPACVLDAAAMMRLRDAREPLQRLAGRLIITPHAGEMAGLLDIDKAEVEGDPVGIARRAASLLGCVVILKGACTHIANPDRETWSCRHGPIGLATSGSGDTLAGLLAGLVGRGAAPLQAALWGVYVHAEAGRRLTRSQGPLGFLARELPPEFPRILAELPRTG